ncbi:MAG: hypothetical protein ACREDE_08940, partial [Thermoplasmata archaeon]
MSFPETNGTYDYTVSTANSTYAPVVPGGSFTVQGMPVGKRVSFELETFAVTFMESGLPTATNWSVTLGGLLVNSTTDRVGFTEPNGTLPYAIQDVPGWHETTLPYQGTVDVRGVTMEPTLKFAEVTYTVTFMESGLAPGTEWWVNLTDGQSFQSRAASISVPEPNGTYEFEEMSVEKGYFASGGKFRVNGNALSETVKFALPTYDVTFSESGLPSTTRWSVTVGGVEQSSTTSTIEFDEPNGTYTYVIGDLSGLHEETLPYTAVLVVAGHSVVEPTLVFDPVTYAVVFTESGFPAGTPWYLNVTGGPSNSSVGGSVGFAEENGTYTYTVATSDKEFESSGGSFAVAGEAVPQTVTFRPVVFTVSFLETGLPAGTNWSVSLAGTSHSSITDTIVFSVTNASYPFTVGPWVGGAAAPSTGTVVVSGVNVDRSISFSATTPGGPTFLGLPGVQGYVLLAELTAAVLLGVGVVLVLLRRRRQTPPDA